MFPLFGCMNTRVTTQLCAIFCFNQYTLAKKAGHISDWDKGLCILVQKYCNLYAVFVHIYWVYHIYIGKNLVKAHVIIKVQGVSKKTLFCDSCSTGGSRMIQRAGYQSKTLWNILFFIKHTFLKPKCVAAVFMVISGLGAAAFTPQVSE